MIRRFFFTEEVEIQLVNSFRDWIESISEDDTGVLYITTMGGHSIFKQPIVDMLNENLNVSICAVGNIHSCGWNIFIECKNKKYLGEFFSCAIVHRSDIDLPTLSIHTGDKKATSYNDYLRLKEIGINETKRASEYLSEDQLDLFTKGEDVLLNRAMVEDILKKIN